MAVTNFTTYLGLALPTQGDLDGTWGTTVNDSITTLLDSAVAGTTTLSVDADVTLTTTNGASNQARNAVILWTASNGATTRNITAPAQSKAYVVINAGTGSVVIRGAGPTTGVTVTSGTKTLVAWNGSDFVKVSSSAISLTSDVTGILPIANGGTNASDATTARTNLSAASSGANTFTAQQTFTGSTTTLAEVLTNAAEVVTVSATAATGTIAFYATSQSVVYLTSNASGNWVVNLTGASTPTTLNTLLSTGQCITLVLMVTNGSTAYYNTSVQVDGTTSGVTTKWASGVAPSSGNINSIEAYTYTVIKTGSATFTVLATRSQFA